MWFPTCLHFFKPTKQKWIFITVGKKYEITKEYYVYVTLRLANCVEHKYRVMFQPNPFHLLTEVFAEQH